MKYVITGAAGNISKPLAEKLLKAGHEVTVISRQEKNIESLISQGAQAAIGSVEDIDFLTKTFTGADAVYTMVPPHFGATDWKAYIGQIGKNFATAIKNSGVQYVLNLSSVGAHLPEGAGPVSGLYRAEQALNELADVKIKHLRPVYFYTNFLASIPMVKHMKIIGSNFGGPGFTMVLTHPDDIAEVAFEELNKLEFTGHSYRYIASDERPTSDIASVIGKAIGQPELPWITFTDEQSLNGLLQAGLPEEIAKNYTEMGHALQSGLFMEDYLINRPAQSGKTKLEDFARQFAAVYQAG
ncbi:MAG: NAD(P)H-binding protein [Chitinophagaceae bacterium]|nr:NAD(P)H-binding protein [Chitinophagaceae bacterium]